MKVMVPVNPARGMDLNGDGRITIDELARSTLLIAAWLFGGLAGIALLVMLIFSIIPTWDGLLKTVAYLAAASMAGAFALGVYRMLRYERLEQRERADWEFEKEKRSWEFDQARGVSAEAQSKTMTQAQVDAAVYQLLSRYYAGREWTREACEKDGAMGAELWNEANALLKKRRIRRGRARELAPETFAEAWGIYCEAKLNANRHKLAGRHDPDWREAD